MSNASDEERMSGAKYETIERSGTAEGKVVEINVSFARPRETRRIRGEEKEKS